MIQIIYIPGLGDHRATLQRLVVSMWRIKGVQPHVYRMLWSNKQPYQEKFDDLLAKIDQLAQKGPVALVGSSAGASAVLNAYAARPNTITAVVCIAGKINNPQTIGRSYIDHAPAFYESALRVNGSLSKITPEMRQHILSVRSAKDEIIPSNDSVIEGAVNRVAWTPGHAFTIAWQLVVGAHSFITFVKKQQKQQ